MNKWLKSAVFYQIYPTSFYDSNSDGIGDLNGIAEKLNYIKDLGINAIWINPFYKSPFKDGGYDIEDYYTVDNRFGNIADFEALVLKCKKLDIKIIIDLVIGHSSDKCKWFLKSAKDKKNKYSDYYIWTDSIFNGYENKTIHGIYPRNGGYYCNYYACQPALNYGFNKIKKSDERTSCYDLGTKWQMHYKDERLKPLQKEVLNIMNFWLQKGIDGFRVDMASSLVKGGVYDSQDSKDLEGIIWLWQNLIADIKESYPNTVFIAEWINPQNSVGKCGFDLDFITHDIPSYNLLFRNEKGTNILPSLEKGHSFFNVEGKGNVSKFLKYAESTLIEINGKGYFSVPTGNHDQVRIAGNRSEDSLKTVFAFLLTFKHIPFIYYGDEIGITHDFNVNKDGGYIRTGARTPMQWTNGAQRGFSKNKKTYLPTNGITSQSVETNECNENSLINTVKKLIKIRAKYDINADVEIKIINADYPLIYTRKAKENIFYVAINPSSKEFIINQDYKKILIQNNCEVNTNQVTLKGESFIILLK